MISSCVLFSIAASAQPKDNSWKDRMMAEKIAFITAEVNLTPEEAQVFWPVYNRQDQLREEAMKAVLDSYRELCEDLSSDKKATKAIDKYIAALENRNKLETEAIKQYRTVLSEEKVGTLLVAEEKFRRTQIRRLHEGGPGAPGAPGRCPEGHDPAPAPEE